MTFLGRSNFFKSCLPVLVGIVMGVALNMTIAPFLDELCDPVSTEDAPNLIQLRETKMVHELNDQQDLKDKLDKDQKGKNDVNEAEESDGNDFYLPEQKYMQEENGGKKFVRPRFASTELGIREKLFVGVLSTPQTVNSFGMALNKTFAHYVTKTQFFTNGKSGFPPPGMHVVSFPDNDNKKLPIHVLKYLKEHYANTFDYYLFITDRTYIRGEKLFELVSHISISEEVHMGALLQKGEKDSCTLDGGILLSQSVLSKMFMQIDSCLMIDEANPSAVFESCITNITQRPCSEKGGDKIYKSYKVDDFDFDDDIDSLRNDVTFNGSYAVYPMPDDTSLYKVHRYFCQLELNLTRQEIQKAKDSIINLSEFAPGGRDSLKWPIGIPEANKPSTRFDIIQWTYFTDSHIYFDDDFTNERPLQGANKQDILEILEVAFERLNANYENKFKQYKLVNGYRRFEPSRGMEYTLDMEVISKNRQDVTQIKRVHLLRPLGKVEILPMPYVTENSQIHLILPLYENEVNDFVNFMEGFAKTVLETSDNSYLFVVFVHQMNQSGKGNGDPFSVPKRLIDYHLNNHPSRKGTITWKVLESDDKGRSEIAVMDHVVRDLQPSDLVSVCSVGMDMDIDYLNRVRMNTVPSVQVFFPISYWQYKQNLVYEQYPYPPGIEFCFPVRSLVRNSEDVSGAWLFEQRAEQRRRFKAVLCTKPKTYAQIKEERKRADREGTQFNPAEIQNLDDDENQQEAPVLDGFFLMRHCCVEDPADLCSVNIAGKELSEYKEEDFALFDNVAYVNAAENYLPFEAFRGFPIIRELEIPLNGLRSIRLSHGDYPTLEIVDISYNNLSHEDILLLGTLPNLKVLHLTGNNFRSLPPDMALPYHNTNSNKKIPRFHNLEILMLDDNKLSNVALFAALAGLRRLRHLNLEKNEIFYVPQLKSVEGSMVVSEDGKDNDKLKKSGKKSSRTPRSERTSRQNRKKSDHTDVASSDPTVPIPTEASLPVPANSEIISNGNTDAEVKINIETNEKEPEVDLNEDFGDLSQTLQNLDINTDLPEPEHVPSNDEKNPIVDKFGLDQKGPPLPPFPELRYLNLCHNLIAEEEALLSVAAWPLLSELLIANNPLTTENSGDPPLLKRFLQDRLGIQLVRKKTTETGKPHVEIPVKKSRKVSNRVPKIPKVPLEERLMLEAPPRPPSTPKPSHLKSIQDKPLPPIQSGNINYHNSPKMNDNIPSTPVYRRTLSEKSESLPGSAVYNRQFSEESNGIPESANYKRQFSEQSNGIPESADYKRQFSEESVGVPESAQYRRAHSQTPQSIPGEADYSRQFSPQDIHVPASSNYTRPYSAGAIPEPKGKNKDKPESKSAWSEEQTDQAFFMTQVDEPEYEQVPKKKAQSKQKTKSEKRKEEKVDERYKGYEILLDYEEDPNFMDPKDMQGNVRALKFALGHELVYRDAAARLDRVHKPVEPYRKWEMPPKVPRKTKGERVDEVLTKLKNRETVDEANLSRVLKDSQSKKKQFPEAQALLAEIQKRYNTVRVNSMKEAREVKKVITSTAHDLNKNAEVLKAA